MLSNKLSRANGNKFYLPFLGCSVNDSIFAMKYLGMAALGFLAGVISVHLFLNYGVVENEEDSAVASSEGHSTNDFQSQRSRGNSSRNSADKESRVRSVMESGDLEEIKVLVRWALEDKPVLLDRMSTVCEIIKLLDAENVDAIREAFDASWDAGFNYTWERQIFLTKFGALMGQEGVESYANDQFQKRALAGWATAQPGEAVDWVNQLAPGQLRSSSIDTLMWSLGKDGSMYCVEVFKAFSDQEQLRKIGSLAQIRKRVGGAVACGELADHFFAEDTPHSKLLAARAYNATLDAYQNDPALEADEWLDQLPPDVIKMFNPNKLPERFRHSEK